MDRRWLVFLVSIIFLAGFSTQVDSQSIGLGIILNISQNINQTIQAGGGGAGLWFTSGVFISPNNSVTSGHVLNMSIGGINATDGNFTQLWSPNNKDLYFRMVNEDGGFEFRSSSDSNIMNIDKDRILVNEDILPSAEGNENIGAGADPFNEIYCSEMFAEGGTFTGGIFMGVAQSDDWSNVSITESQISDLAGNTTEQMVDAVLSQANNTIEYDDSGNKWGVNETWHNQTIDERTTFADTNCSDSNCNLTGDLNFSDAMFIDSTSGQLLFSDGVSSAPGIALKNATGTGFYKSGSNLNIAIAGTNSMSLSTYYMTFAANNIKMDYHQTYADADTISSWNPDTGTEPYIAMRNDAITDKEIWFIDSKVGVNTTNPTDTLTINGSCNLIHTATEADDRAFEIDVDAAGFGDVKGIDLFYDTGAMALGSDEAIILINLDESEATGGDVFALEVLATEGSANVYGLKAGALVGPIHQDSGVFTNMDSGTVKGVDKLTEFTSTASDVSIFVNDNDNITVGNAAKFEELEFLLNTTASNPGIKPTLEFSTGIGTWDTFTPVDGTNGMRNTGIIAWEDDDIPTWATGVGSEYLIRVTRTMNNLNTVPIEDKIQIASVVEYQWTKEGNLNVNEINASTGNFSGDVYIDGWNVSDTNDTLKVNEAINTDCGSDEKVIGRNTTGGFICVPDNNTGGVDTRMSGVGYLSNDTYTIFMDEAILNKTIDARNWNATNGVDTRMEGIGYLTNDTYTIYMDEAILNLTIDARNWNITDTDTDTRMQGVGYLNNDTYTIFINEAVLNSTIDARNYNITDTNTRMSGVGYLTNDTFTIYMNEAVLNKTIDARNWNISDTDTDTRMEGIGYLTNDTFTIFMNEAILNATIDARNWNITDTNTDTRMSGIGYLTNDTFTIFMDEAILNATIDARNWNITDTDTRMEGVGYLSNDTHTIFMDEAILNKTIDARNWNSTAGIDTRMQGVGYLTNDTFTIFMNEAVLNLTIDARNWNITDTDTDTRMEGVGYLTNDTFTISMDESILNKTIDARNWNITDTDTDTRMEGVGLLTNDTYTISIVMSKLNATIDERNWNITNTDTRMEGVGYLSNDTYTISVDEAILNKTIDTRNWNITDTNCSDESCSNMVYYDNTTGWCKDDSTVLYSNGTRAMTGNLNMDFNNITNPIEIKTSYPELILNQTGDVYGSTWLSLRNRVGLNGVIFGNEGLDLVDLGFIGSSGEQHNIRMERRSTALEHPTNIGGEFQFIGNVSSGERWVSIGGNMTTFRMPVNVTKNITAEGIFLTSIKNNTGENIIIGKDNETFIELKSIGSSAQISLQKPVSLDYGDAEIDPAIFFGNQKIEATSGGFKFYNDSVGQIFHITGAGDVIIQEAGGSTTPTHKLDIKCLYDDDCLRLRGPDGFYEHGSCLNLGDGDLTRICEPLDDYLEVYGSTSLWLRSGGLVNISDQMYVSYTNNIVTMPRVGSKLGIGTGGPTQALDVNGSENLTGDLWVGGSIYSDNNCGVPSANFWAEENDWLGNQTYEWGFGDAGPGEWQAPLQPCSGNITAVSIRCAGGGTNTRIIIQRSRANTTCEIGLVGGANQNSTTCEASFPANEYLHPYTLDAGGAGWCVVSWWVRYD